MYKFSLHVDIMENNHAFPSFRSYYYLQHICNTNIFQVKFHFMHNTSLYDQQFENPVKSGRTCQRHFDSEFKQIEKYSYDGQQQSNIQFLTSCQHASNFGFLDIVQTFTCEHPRMRSHRYVTMSRVENLISVQDFDLRLYCRSILSYAHKSYFINI